MSSSKKWVNKKELSELFPILTTNIIDQLISRGEIPYARQYNPDNTVKICFLTRQIDRWLKGLPYSIGIKYEDFDS